MQLGWACGLKIIFTGIRMRWIGRKTFLVMLLPCVGLAAHAQSDWLTVSAGDAGSADSDIVEVDADSGATKSGIRTMDIRVSRSKVRSSWDGVQYRSYNAAVAIDCAAKTGRYVSLDFYRLPLWKGTSHRTSTYTSAELRPMQFLDVFPNPTERIIRAACPTPSR